MEFDIEPIVREGRARLLVSVDGIKWLDLNPDDARDLAVNLITRIHEAEADALLWKYFLAGGGGIVELAGTMLARFRAIRREMLAEEYDGPPYEDSVLLAGTPFGPGSGEPDGDVQ